MKKENTYCLAQRVKAAVMLQPSLLEEIVKRSTTNVKIVESTIRRLLPYWTSVEIEHINHKLCFHVEEMVKLRNSSFTAYIEYDCGDTETKLSLIDPLGLPNFYKALDVLKSYSKVDMSGSIHVHVDIRNWFNNPDKRLSRVIGIMILSEMQGNKTVDAFRKEILLNSIKIAYPNTCFDTSYDNLVGTNNEKTIGVLNLEQSTGMIVLKKIADNIKEASRKELRNVWSKKSWINIRGDFRSIEIRTFPCSFDYETIIQFMIEANKLTKRILQICDYLGSKARSNNYVID